MALSFLFIHHLMKLDTRNLPTSFPLNWQSGEMIARTGSISLLLVFSDFLGQVHIKVKVAVCGLVMDKQRGLKMVV